MRVGRRVDSVAAGLIGAQLVARAIWIHQGFYFEDDFRYLHSFLTSGFTTEYLFQDYNGHLMPGQFLLVGVLQRLAAMDFELVVVTLLVLQLMASILVWRVLRALVGPRPAALVGLAVYLFSPLTLSASLWYAAALQAVPLQVVSAAALWFMVRYLRGGKPGDAGGVVLAYVVGLVFWEKALLILPLLTVVTLLWFVEGGPLRRLLGALRSWWRLWSVLAALTLCYVAWYVSRVRWQLGGDAGTSRISVAFSSIFRGFLPAAFGGPYSGRMGPLGVESVPTPALVVVFAIAGLAVVAATMLTMRAAWRAWCLLAVFLIADVLLLAGTDRAAVIGPSIGVNVRFLADLGVALAVALTCAIAPVRASEPVPASTPRWIERPKRLSSLLFAYVAGCAVTSLAVVNAWADTSAEPFVRRAQSDLRTLGDVVIYDDQPPPDVLSPWFLDDARLSRVLGPLPEKPRFDLPTDQLYVVSGDGAVRPATYDVGVGATIDTDSACGLTVPDAGAVTVPLDASLYSWRWTVRIDYTASAAGGVLVALGDRLYTVPVLIGNHSAYIVHTGPLQDVRLGGAAASLDLCVRDVSVGQIRSGR